MMQMTPEEIMYACFCGQRHPVNRILCNDRWENVAILTDSFRETVDTVNLDTFLPSAVWRSAGQSPVPPTICPWIAVPRTVPSTSIVMPARVTEMEDQ